MKKSWFLAIIMAVCFSSCNNKPQQYTTHEEALSYMFNVLKNGGRNIPLKDCVMYVSSSINWNYSTKGFEVITIQCTDGDSIINQICVEYTPYFGWYAEKNKESFSKNGIENLRPLTMAEKKYVKIAYENIINME